MSINGEADLIDSTVRRQRRAVRSTCGAELNGPVDSSIEQMFLFLIRLHQVYRGTQQFSEEMVDPLENGGVYPRPGAAEDARAVSGAVAAVDA